MYTIYHNPRCSKSRAGLAHLKAIGGSFEIIKYLDSGLSREGLEGLLKKLGCKAEDLVRTQEEYYKKELKGKSISESEWLDILIEHPRLLKRPIVVKESKAVWAVPAEEIDQL